MDLNEKIAARRSELETIQWTLEASQRELDAKNKYQVRLEARPPRFNSKVFSVVLFSVIGLTIIIGGEWIAVLSVILCCFVFAGAVLFQQRDK